MAKEKIQEPALTDEQLAEARKQIRKDMREKFDKWMNVYDEEATSDDINAAKKEFDDEVAKYTNATYTIIEKDALPYAELLQKWNRTLNSWEKGEWKGILVFDKLISEKIEELKSGKTNDLTFDYSTLIFLYQTMANPRGVGYESAKLMSEFENYDEEKSEIKDNENFVTYSHILQSILEHIRKITNVDKKLKLMRERINIAASGIKFDWKISEVEEFIELHDAWIGASVDEQMPQ